MKKLLAVMGIIIFMFSLCSTAYAPVPRGIMSIHPYQHNGQLAVDVISSDINNGVGFVSFGADLTYDSSLLTFDRCDAREVLTSSGDKWVHEYIARDENTMRIACASTYPLYDGNVMTLYFNVAENAVGKTVKLFLHVYEIMDECEHFSVKSDCMRYFTFGDLITGDFNNDDTLDTGDAVAILKRCLQPDITEDDLRLGDFNNDGAFDTGDASAVLCFYMNMPIINQ